MSALLPDFVDPCEREYRQGHDSARRIAARFPERVPCLRLIWETEQEETAKTPDTGAAAFACGMLDGLMDAPEPPAPPPPPIPMPLLPWALFWGTFWRFP